MKVTGAYQRQDILAGKMIAYYNWFSGIYDLFYKKVL